MTVFFFDFDDTLYHFDHMARLPALARIVGSSQYHLASTWWVAGFERRAELGEYATSDAYLAEWERVTGVPMTLEQWQDARAAAMSPNEAMIDVLRECSTIGTVSLLSNNPIPFRDSIGRLAPDVAAILGDNLLTSAELGARKPDPELYHRALARFDEPANDSFFVDDSRGNVAGASDVGIHAVQFRADDAEASLARIRSALAAVGARS